MTQLRTIPLDQLKESKRNPRKHYDQAALAALAVSVKASGVLTPLKVRPVAVSKTAAGHYEIGAGHRRFRAAKQAGLTDVPCLVEEMDDAAFELLLNVENNQRDNLDALDEAHGFENMMKGVEAGTPATIGATIGRSTQYVYDRLKLLQLAPDLQTMFSEGRFTLGHAIILARLSRADQKRCVGDERGGLFQRDEAPTLDFAPALRKACSVRELEGWVNKHVRFQTAVTDEMELLFPETAIKIGGNTVTAAQATGKDAKADTVVSITRDHFVQPEVRDEKHRIFGPMSWRRADGKDKSKTCERSVLGVVAVGPGRGEAFRVCLDKAHCTVHYGTEIKARAQRAKAAAKGEKVESRSEAMERHEAAQKKQQAEHEAHRVLSDRWHKARPELFKALAARLAVQPAGPSSVTAQLLLSHIHVNRVPRKEAGKHLTVGKTPEDVVRFATFLMLVERVVDWNGPLQFPTIAKALGFDAVKIVDRVAPPAPKVEAASEKVAPAPKKAKKSAKPAAKK